MNVIIFSHAAGSPEHGPNMRWYYIGKRLVELGHSVTIIGSSWFHKYNTHPSLGGEHCEKEISGIRYVWVKAKPYKTRLGQLKNQFQYAVNAIRFVCKVDLSGNNNVIVSSSPTPHAILPALFLSKKNKCPLIYEVRDLWPLVIQNLSQKSKFHPYFMLMAILERISIHNSNAVTSVKPGDFEYFKQKYKLKESEFSYIPNGLLPEEIRSKNTALEYVEKKQFVVGYIGAMSSYYGLIELIEAAKLLKDDKSIKFRLVGGGEDLEVLIYLKEIYKLDNVEFTGKLSRQDAMQELNNFDVCFLGLKDVKANLYGISCNKLYEYMFYAKPIIASYITNYDPVQFSKAGITVRPNNPNEIKDAILLLKNDKNLYNSCSINAREYFFENHDLSKITSKYVDVFTKVIRNND